MQPEQEPTQGKLRGASKAKRDTERAVTVHEHDPYGLYKRTVVFIRDRHERGITPTRTTQLPSEVHESYWIYAKACNLANYPEGTSQGGKWLIFATKGEPLDALWLRCVGALGAGLLGETIKVATMCDNPHASKQEKGVICVYTYNGDDKADVMRIREELRTLGITWRIPYKADADTCAGHYAEPGQRISKYYE